MTGSLINALYEGGTTRTAPAAGVGATATLWTDRHAGTITWVAANGKTLKWKRDKATRTDSHGMSDAQSYRYEEDPAAATITYTLRKNGRWVKKGLPMKGSGGLIIGIRDEHYDFSF